MSWAGLAHLGEMVFNPRSYEIFYLTSTKEFVMSLEKGFSITSQKIFVGLEDFFNTFSAQQFVLKTSWRHLAKRLEDILEDEKLLRWRRLENVLKTSWKQTNLNVHIFDLVNLHLTNLLPDKSNANPKFID